jgi:two-component system cell cycle response regulator DivK
MAGETILIVEDNERNMKLVRDILQFKGYQPLCAGTAEEGLALAAEHQPALILMDVHLPGMDGVAALGRLRDVPETRKIPVVALTASAMKEDQPRLLAAGFDGYLAKPIEVRQFPDQVRQILDRAAASADTGTTEGAAPT